MSRREMTRIAVLSTVLALAAAASLAVGVLLEHSLGMADGRRQTRP